MYTFEIDDVGGGFGNRIHDRCRSGEGVRIILDRSRFCRIRAATRRRRRMRLARFQYERIAARENNYVSPPSMTYTLSPPGKHERVAQWNNRNHRNRVIWRRRRRRRNGIIRRRWDSIFRLRWWWRNPVFWRRRNGIIRRRLECIADLASAVPQPMEQRIQISNKHRIELPDSSVSANERINSSTRAQGIPAPYPERIQFAERVEAHDVQRVKPCVSQ